ncbi:right-handed parallel beta-helix repeat-containing protein, partial [Bacteroidota bacterium]
MKRIVFINMIVVLLSFVLNIFTLYAQEKNKCFILFDVETIEEMNSAIDYIESEGGEVTLISPLHTAVGYIDPYTARSIEGSYGVKRIYYDKVSQDEIPYKDFSTENALFHWNQKFEELPKREIEPFIEEPLYNDVLKAPFVTTTTGLSDTLSGKVVVSIFFPESNGAIDSSSENWSNARVQRATAEIKDAMSWWNQQIKNHAPWMDTLQFTFIEYPPNVCPVSYEPITRKGITSGFDTTGHWLWIKELLNGRADGTNTWEKAINHNKNMKDTYGTKWAFTIFIVDDSSDTDHKFSDSSSYYAYTGGPFEVVAYNNGNWGYWNMNRAVMHETGHIFTAPDEYKNSKCHVSQIIKGYPNLNCENPLAPGVPNPFPMQQCVMKSNSYAVCPLTRGHIGWNPGPNPSKIDIKVEPVQFIPGDTAVITVSYKNIGHEESNHGVINVSFPQYRHNSSVSLKSSPDNSTFTYKPPEPDYRYVEWYDKNWQVNEQNTIKLNVVHDTSGQFEIYVRSFALLKNTIWSIVDPKDSPVKDQKGEFVHRFTYNVQPASITITNLNEKTYKTLGSTCDIYWSSENLTEDVVLLLKEVDEKPPHEIKIIDTIATLPASLGTFAWIIPEELEPGELYFIEIQSKEYNNIYDRTDNFLVLCKRIEVVYPNGFEGLNAGEKVDIKWKTAGINGEVNIFLIPEVNNQSENPLIIIPAEDDDSSFSWTVPNNLTEWAKIEIKRVDYPGNSDRSDDNFFINNQSGFAWVVYNSYCGPGADSLPGTLPWTARKLWDTQAQADRIVFSVGGPFNPENDLSISLYEKDAIDGTTFNGDVILNNCSIWLHGGETTVKGIIINNQGQNDYGILTTSYHDSILSKITIDNNVINGCNSGGIQIIKTADVYITNNKIGTDKTGITAVPNGQGISLQRSDNVHISNNIISGNYYEGIWAPANRVNNLFITNNLIGLNAAGTDTLGNGSMGIVKSLYVIYFDGDDPEYDENIYIEDNFIAGNGWKDGSGDGINVGHHFPMRDVVIRNNYVGVDTLGNKSLGNYGWGINVYNIDGLLIMKNFISANKGGGISINKSGGDIQYYKGIDIIANTIGLNKDADSALGNGNYGIEACISKSYIQNNIISGNAKSGLYIHDVWGVQSDSNYIQRNTFGGSLFGNDKIPNSEGLYITSDYNVIGGDSSIDRNLIGDGLSLYGDYNKVYGNYIGLDYNGETSNSRSYRSGIYSVAAHHNEIKRNYICGFNTVGSYGGIRMLGCSYNTISGNWIGINKKGQVVPNHYGIVIDKAYEANNGNKIINNLVAGNNHIGIYLANTEGNEVRNNFVGIDFWNLNPLYNSGTGIKCENVSNTIIGSANYDSANTVLDGIYFSDCTNMEVTYNYIGTNSITSRALGKDGTDGIYMNNCNANEIQNNVISGNGGNGVKLENSGKNTFTDNKIGTNSLGNTAIANSGIGIEIINGGSNILGDLNGINVIAGNDSTGVYIHESDSNKIVGNIIGHPNAQNKSDGICITGSSNFNEITSDTIQNNEGNGIVLYDSGVKNLIEQNSIHTNSLMGIDLGGDGVTLNDEGDSDSGPNGLLNYPEITTIEEIGLNEVFNINGNALPGSKVELYITDYYGDFSGHGEGED